MWDAEFGWLWTRKDVFPHLYNHQSDGWFYFIRSTDNQRAFFNYATEQFELR